jgi:hypothetical protein
VTGGNRRGVYPVRLARRFDSSIGALPRAQEGEAAEIAERATLAGALTFDHVIDEAVEANRRHAEAPK